MNGTCKCHWLQCQVGAVGCDKNEGIIEPDI